MACVTLHYQTKYLRITNYELRIMKIPVKLQELIPQPEAAILLISSLMGQKLALVDCTNVAELTPEQLNLIFTHIPPTWDYQELTEIFNPDTLTETFAIQLCEYIDHRLGRTPTSSLITNYYVLGQVLPCPQKEHAQNAVK
jgi:hypothetical protein